MAKAFFISEEKIKQDSIFNDNIDSKYIRSLIDECQDIYILPILGSALYIDLQDKIIAETLTSNDTLLLTSYVVPCLKGYIKAEAPYELLYKFTNKNVGVKNSEFSTPISASDLKDITQHYKNKAEYYGQKLKLFLKANFTLYPKYYEYGNSIDSVQPLGRVWDSGMNLDDDTGCGAYVNGRYLKSGRDR